ncbi:MAG: response regulator transcription factor [Alteromonadaceae bacterium]|nr:response regulator transcription factor [Alteromonadaceae bacterium]
MNNPVNVLIVDDEPLARVELCRLLSMFEDIEVVAQAVDAPDALAKIKQHQIDLVFLDINMPEINGLELAELLQEHNCSIIFCTAYDNHALEAFSLNALDYLTKPVNVKRLSQSLQKYRKLHKQDKHHSEHNQHSPAYNDNGELDMNKQVLLKDGENMQLITPSQIEQIISVGNYIKIKGDGLNMLVQNTLSYLESRLNKQYFIRANRQTIINLQKVRKMDLSISGSYLLTMQSNEEVEVSRRQGQILRNMFSL